MLKKLLLISLILTSSAAFASLNTPTAYIGPTLLLKASTTKNENAREISPRFSIGYGGKVSDGIYLAGEAFGILGSYDVSSSKSSSTTTGIKTTNSFGLSIIPGVLISDETMAFARLGAIRSRFSEANKSVTGYQAGLGLQTALNPCWDLRGEYTYTIYNSIAGIGIIRSDWYGIGVVYNFT